MATVNINAIVLFLENSQDIDAPVSLEEAEKHFGVELTDEQRKEVERQLQENEKNAQEEEEEAMQEADRIEEDYAGNE